MDGEHSQGRYTVGELAELAGVTPRTVRYYTAEGLLPAPDLRGKYALYSAEHLDRLVLIKQLKDAFFPLQEIRTRMAHLSAQEVSVLLTQSSAPPASSALGGLAELTRRTGSQVGVLRETSSAADYIAQVLTSRPPAAPPPTVSSPAPAAPAPARSRQPSPAQPQAEAWRRVELAPGLEIHVRESAAAEFDGLLKVLIPYVQRLIHPEEAPDDD